MTASPYADAILANCQPLVPQPTNVEPRLGRLDGIRAVLFDIYGTLIISASGDVGADSGDHRLVALQQSCSLFKLALSCPPDAAIRSFEDEIADSHRVARAEGVEYPEIDIVGIWQAVLPRIAEGDVSSVDLQRFALEYEVRVNPVWPMPGVVATLDRLATSELVLGIVSNAQFFTPLLFPPLLSKSTEELGFVPSLSYFSYEHQQAKPGIYLYELARRQLAELGIPALAVLYVGNDMLNDVAAAAAVGFRTALFAGDRRSLRWREDDARVQGVVPDRVVTALPQLLECVAV